LLHDQAESKWCAGGLGNEAGQEVEVAIGEPVLDVVRRDAELEDSVGETPGPDLGKPHVE
jgi:hypothetical protein